MNDLDSYHRIVLINRSIETHLLGSHLQFVDSSVFWGKVEKDSLFGANPHPDVAEDKFWSKKIICKALDHLDSFPDRATQVMFAGVISTLSK